MMANAKIIEGFFFSISDGFRERGGIFELGLSTAVPCTAAPCERKTRMHDIDTLRRSHEAKRPRASFSA